MLKKLRLKFEEILYISFTVMIYFVYCTTYKFYSYSLLIFSLEISCSIETCRTNNKTKQIANCFRVSRSSVFPCFSCTETKLFRYLRQYSDWSQNRKFEFISRRRSEYFQLWILRSLPFAGYKTRFPQK